MGNRAKRRLAGELQKRHGLPRRYRSRKIEATNSHARTIVSFLGLKPGQVVFDYFDGCNHVPIGVLCQKSEPYDVWSVRHLVYSFGGIGSDAFDCQTDVDAPMATDENIFEQIEESVTCDWNRFVRLQLLS